jgi:phosphonate transport system substrate-binding protein
MSPAAPSESSAVPAFRARSLQCRLGGACLALLLAFLAPAVPAAELVLGRVSDDPKSDYPRLKAMLDYVVPRMADVGITSGRVLMAPDTLRMSSYLRRGKVDWISETPGAAAGYLDRGRARVLLLTQRGGMDVYRSVFFARRDAGIASLADLRGRTIAFQNLASTSAYLLPASLIVESGLPLVVLASPGDEPSPDVVGFVFARSELNMSTWVHKGLVDAAAFSEQDWADADRVPEAFRPDLAIFGETERVPRALEVVRSDLDPAVAARLAAVLLGAIDDPAAADPLRRFWSTTGFREPDAQTLDEIRAFSSAVRRVRDEIE